MTDSTTRDPTTTSGGEAVVTRVLYHPFVDHLGEPSASAVKSYSTNNDSTG